MFAPTWLGSAPSSSVKETISRENTNFFLFSSTEQLITETFNAVELKVSLRYNQDSYFKRHVSFLTIISKKFYGGTMKKIGFITGFLSDRE